MTIYKALSVSEELNCAIIHREAGLRISANDDEIDFLTLPSTGWAVDDTLATVEFQALFLGCDKMDATAAGGLHGCVYSFEGTGIYSVMTPGTLVKVRIEAL